MGKATRLSVGIFWRSSNSDCGKFWIGCRGVELVVRGLQGLVVSCGDAVEDADAGVFAAGGLGLCVSGVEGERMGDFGREDGWKGRSV